MNEAPQAQSFFTLNLQPTIVPLTVERFEDPVYSQIITKETPKVKGYDVKSAPYVVKAKNNVLGLGQMN